MQRRRMKKSLTERFWSKVNKTSTCWIWTAAVRGKGYGHLWVNDKTESAHRISLRLHGIAVPDELLVDHMCRNKLCVNPSHLRLVTARINSIENSVGPTARKAAQTHCKCGHALSGENLVIKSGRRGCRICILQGKRDYARRRRLREANHAKQ